MNGPLSSIKVLDLSRVLAAPWAGQNLADMGADVIKVERPTRGDDTRGFGPPWVKDAQGKDTGESVYYAATNRNKRSITINLSHPKGQELVRQIAAKVDVVLENYKTGDLARYHLAYLDLQAINPKLIYCSVTGFGQDGPYSERPGYDFMMQGMSGLMSVTGHPAGEPGGEPMKAGVPIIDMMTGMYATVAICAGLVHRLQTGEGQYIDTALLDTAMAFASLPAMNYLVTGEEQPRIGNTHPTIVPYQVFATGDGNLVLACGNDQLFAKFCKVAGCEQFLVDTRFATNSARVVNRKILIPLLQEIFYTRSTSDWITALETAGLPCGPINSLSEAFAEPQVLARKIRVDMPHATGGTVPTIASPLRFSATPVKYRYAPPMLGEHTQEILQEMGYSISEIEGFRSEGVI